MKTYNYIITFILSIGLLFSCSDDRLNQTINPDAESGKLSFVLNEGEYSNFTYVLEEKNNGLSMETLYCSQPDYGFSAAVSYYIETSFNEDMSDHVVLSSSVQGETININVKEMNKAIFDLYGGDMPTPSVEKDIYIRLRAIVSTATKDPLTNEPTVKPAYSNVIKLTVLPYFIVNLKPYNEAEKLLPYFIIGYAGWDNNDDGYGTSLLPLSVVEGNVYDTEGQGIYSYTGFFEASKSFKLIRDVGSWNEQWGNAGGDGIDNIVHNDGGAGNLKVAEDGYYTITLNSITNELKVEKASISPKVYDSMGIVGTINNWGDTPDIAMKSYQDVNNHVWYAEYTFATDDECKFRYNSDWGTSWGGNHFPVGLGGGDNIKVEAGTYVVFYNDIDGSYTFIKK